MGSTPLVLRACTVDPLGVVTRADGREEHLSPRERELLDHLVRNAHRPVARDELLTEVWQYAPSVVSRAVDTTVRRLREKIEADPQRPDHVMTAFGEGYRFVHGGAAPVPPPVAPEAEPFVGRADEVQALVASLSRPGSAMLLLGPPGAGKTRLARHLAHRLAPALRGGSLTLDLTEARDLPEVAAVAVGSLGIDAASTGTAALRRAGDALRARGPCLVVLDNCEGVSPAVAEALGAWRPAAPDARFLATSRQPLAGADTVQLGPLPLAEAVDLFAILAQRVKPDFRLEPVRDVVEELVERLERLPLALALAAGRVHALSPRAILDRLDDRFRVLASRGRSDLRHATLRAALDGSWELLGPAERHAYLACSTFRGGFDPAAARRVVDSPRTDALLDELCARSLLERRGERFGGYAFVREYGEERLAAEPALEESLHRRHAEHFAWLPLEPAPALFTDRANLAVAAARAAERGWADLAGAAALRAIEVAVRRGPYEEGVAIARRALAVPGVALADQVAIGARLVSMLQWSGAGDPWPAQAALADAAARSGDPGLLAASLRSRSILARSRGSATEALEDVLAAIDLARRSARIDALCILLCTLGNTYRELNRIPEAQACWNEVVSYAAQGASEDSLVNAMGNLALLARRLGRWAEARDLYQGALDRKIALGDRRGEGTARVGLANLELDLGHWDAARAQYAIALEIAEEIGSTETRARVLGNLALCARAAGRIDEARELGEQALGAFDALGERRQAAMARGNLGELELVDGNPDLAAAILERSVEALVADADHRSAAELTGPWCEALLELGRVDEARAHLAPAEATARRLADPVLLAQLLARRGMIEAAEGGDPAATLAEAEALASGTRPTSDTAKVLARLRARLG